MAHCLQIEMYNREFDTIAVIYRLHKKTKENEDFKERYMPMIL